MVGENSLETRGETFFLNLRFMLIITVFAGNAIEPLINKMSGIHGLYMWIFSFHMPLFVLVTGYFARKSLAGTTGRKMLLQIGLQYLIFQSLYSALDVSLFHVSNIQHSIFAPYLLLWFLASHACWRLLMLGMSRWSITAKLLFAVTAGVAVGYLSWTVYGLASAVPLYICLFHYRLSFLLRNLRQALSEIYQNLCSSRLHSTPCHHGRMGAGFPFGWLYGSMTYMQIDANVWYAGVYRLGLYGLQIVASLAFLGLVPYGASRMTDWGRRTLYVFLLHGFIVRLAAVSGIYTYIGNAAGAVVLLLTAVLFTVLLAQPSVKRLFHPLVEPSVDWMITLQRAALRRTL